MRIELTSVFVDDQQRALEFYTGALGFVLADDLPIGADRWITVTAPDRPEGPRLLLEPDRHPAASAYAAAIRADGIPAASFAVDDLAAEHDRLVALGVEFRQPPTDIGPVIVAVLDDTVGNLLQLVQDKGDAAEAPAL